MRFRTTIILFLILAGLAAFVYWFELPKAELEAKKKTVVELKEDDVTEVSLVYPDREIVLKKSGNEWRLVKPVDALADAVAVKSLLTAVAQAEVGKELAEPSSDLAQYGLDKPTVRVTLHAGEKTLPGIVVGKAAPVGSNAYVKKADDNKVYLTGATLRTALDKQVKDLRDKTILSFSDADVRGIEIQSDGNDVVLSQKDNKWVIEKPVAFDADGTTIRNFLSTLRSLRAVDFAAEQAPDLSAFGLDKPRLAVSLTMGDAGVKQTLSFGKENEQKQIYVQRNGQPVVFAVNDWVLRDLNKNAGDFRDKTVLAFDRDKVRAILVAAKDGKTKLVRGDDKKWRVEGAEGKPSEPVINQYLADMADLKGYEIAADQPSSLAEFGLDPPQVVITMFGEGDQEIGTVLLGERKGAEGKVEHTAIKAGGTTVLLVRDYLVTRLNKRPDGFVEKPTTPGAAAPPAPAAMQDEEDVEDEDTEMLEIPANPHGE